MGNGAGHVGTHDTAETEQLDLSLNALSRKDETETIHLGVLLL
jgi:hypothetical protein